MGFIRAHGVRLAIWLAVGLLFFFVASKMRNAERDAWESMFPIRKEARLAQENWESTSAERWELIQKQNREYKSNLPKLWQGNITQAANMTKEEREDLSLKYNRKFLPALTNWFVSYENKIPFNVADVTLDKFHSTFGSRMFTFMIGSTTLTFSLPLDPNDDAKVSYLMVKQSALQMNATPTSGFVPDLNARVTREEIIRMVKADTGIEFTPHEVRIVPTAKSTALNGGAFVDIIPKGLDPNNAMNAKLSMVFDSAGKLVNYERSYGF